MVPTMMTSSTTGFHNLNSNNNNNNKTNTNNSNTNFSRVNMNYNNNARANMNLNNAYSRRNNASDAKISMTSTVKSQNSGLNRSMMQMQSQMNPTNNNNIKNNVQLNSSNYLMTTSSLPAPSSSSFFCIQKDPQHIRAQNVTIDDMLNFNLFHSKRRLKTVSQASLYNRTLDNESASMTMFNASKIDLNCRGYSTRRGLKRKRPANAPDPSNLSMDATIKSLNNQSILDNINFINNDNNNIRKEQQLHMNNSNLPHHQQQVVFSTQNQTIDRMTMAMLLQRQKSLQMQDMIKRISLSEIFAKINPVLDETAIVDRSVEEMENFEENNEIESKNEIINNNNNHDNVITVNNNHNNNNNNSNDVNVDFNRVKKSQDYDNNVDSSNTTETPIIASENLQIQDLKQTIKNSSSNVINIAAECNEKQIES